MSDLKDELKSVTIDINDLLSGYIKIHDCIFKFSWRKTFPLPFFFKKIDFKGLHTETTHIIGRLEICNNRITSALNEITAQDRRFAYFLSEYCMALIDATSLLKDILCQLHLKRENLNEYNLIEHKKLCNLYNKAVDKYYNTGNRLNELYSEFVQ